jgi:hypothetical protein
MNQNHPLILGYKGLQYNLVKSFPSSWNKNGIKGSIFLRKQTPLPGNLEVNAWDFAHQELTIFSLF